MFLKNYKFSSPSQSDLITPLNLANYRSQFTIKNYQKPDLREVKKIN